MANSGDVERVSKENLCTSLLTLTLVWCLSGYRGRGDGEWRGRGEGKGIPTTILPSLKVLIWLCQASVDGATDMKVTVAVDGDKVNNTAALETTNH